MRILITNDDGVRAPGIAVLAKALQQDGHQIAVAAPAQEQSGVGHGLTFLTPVFVEPYQLPGLDVPAFSVWGKPADCTKIGTDVLAGFHPELVVSGINRGGNLGTDVMPSGTVSAALEAVVMGIPALAVSLQSFLDRNYDCAAAYAVELVRYMERRPTPKGILLSLNVPDLPREEVKGLKLAPLDSMSFDFSYKRYTDPLGRPFYWLMSDWETRQALKEEPRTDRQWVAAGYATVTPIKMDWTSYEYLETMKHDDLFQED